MMTSNQEIVSETISNNDVTITSTSEMISGDGTISSNSGMIPVPVTITDDGTIPSISGMIPATNDGTIPSTSGTIPATNSGTIPPAISYPFHPPSCGFVTTEMPLDTDDDDAPPPVQLPPIPATKLPSPHDSSDTGSYGDPSPSNIVYPKSPYKEQNILIKIEELEKHTHDILANKVKQFFGERNSKEYFLLEQLIDENFKQLDDLNAHLYPAAKQRRKLLLRKLEDLMDELEAKTLFVACRTPEESPPAKIDYVDGFVEKLKNIPDSLSSVRKTIVNKITSTSHLNVSPPVPQEFTLTPEEEPILGKIAPPEEEQVVEDSPPAKIDYTGEVIKKIKRLPVINSISNVPKKIMRKLSFSNTVVPPIPITPSPSVSESSDILSLVNHLKSLVPFDIQDLPMIGVLVFTLASFLLVLIKALRTSTKGLKLILFTTFSALWSAIIMLTFKYYPELIPTTSLSDASSEILDHVTNVKSDAQEAFEEHCLKNKFNKARIISYYKEVDRNFLLPLLAAPSMFIYSLKPRIHEFKYGDDFLSIYWGLKINEILRLRRLIRMADLVDLSTIDENSTNWAETIDDKTPSQVLEQQLNMPVDLSTISGVLCRLIIVCIYFGECIFSKSTFSFTKLMACLKNTKELHATGVDLNRLIGFVRGIEDPEAIVKQKAADFTAEFNEFMKIPTYVFAKQPRKLKGGEALCRSFENFHAALDKEGKQTIASLHGLYVSVNTRIQTYYSTEVMSLARQEPFIICFTGQPGIGKTQLVRTFMKRLALNHYATPPTDAIVEITPEDKYWPPLSGQEIAFFDDSCGKRDLKEDLLWNSIKGICSPAFFNAAGASIMAKINPINFKIIFTTTNTSFDDMGQRVAAGADAATWAAYARRMILVDTIWHSSIPPNPESIQQFKPDFSHLRLNLYTYQQGKVLPNRTVTYDQLYNMVVQREQRLAQEFNKHIIAYSAVPEASKSHYSVVFHGRQGQGKSYIIGDTGNSLALSMNLDCKHYTTLDSLPKKKFAARKVVVLDDVVTPDMSTEDEKRVMDFYNHTLVDGSIVLFGTNVSPTYSIPFVSLDNVITQRQLNFKNEGLIRRIGYQGYFTSIPMPESSTEIFVSNLKYYQFMGNKVLAFIPLWRHICSSDYLRQKFCALLLFLLSFYTIYPSILVTLGFIYWFNRPNYKELDQRTISEILFNRIQTFYKDRNGFEIKDVQNLPSMPKQPNIIIRCKVAKNFLHGITPQQLDKHLFTNMDLFINSPLPWKIFLDEIVLRKMTQNIERFIVGHINFDEKSILSLLNRFVPLFSSLQIDPIFDLRFDDVGDYLYINKVLHRVQRNHWHQTVLPYVEIFSENVINVVFDGHYIPVMMFLYNLDEVLKRFDYEARQTLTIFHRSSEFREKEEIKQIILNTAMRDAKSMAHAESKILLDRVRHFRQTPAGIITIILLGILSAFTLFVFVTKYMTSTKKKGKKAKVVVDESYSSDDPAFGSPESDSSDSETGYWFPQKKNKSRKGSPKSRAFDSDDDRKKQFISIICQGKKSKRKDSPKKNYNSDDGTLVREDVVSLVDVNGYDSLRPYVEVANQKARKNLCQIYALTSDKEIVDFEPSAPLCYGLFIKENILVTVGHVTDMESKNTMGWRNRLFCGFDGTKNFYRLHRLVKYPTRDLAVFRVEALKTQFPDITSIFFATDEFKEGSVLNSAIQRFGLGKKEEFHTGEMGFNAGPDMFTDGKLCKWGSVVYGSYGIKLTEGGDCGLPYYAVEKENKYHNKVFGIHCMGNRDGSATVGVCAIIYKEDIAEWTKTAHSTKVKQVSDCCKYDDLTIVPDISPKCSGHVNVWHKEHDSTMTTFYEEYQHFIDENKKFKGGIIKNSGEMYGTQKHSHTQFLPFEDVVEFDVGKPVITTLSKYKEGVVDQPLYVRTIELPETSLKDFTAKHKIAGQDFRVRAYRYITKQKAMLRISTYLFYEEKDPKQEVRDVVTFPSHYGAPIYVTPSTEVLLSSAKKNRERGKLEDVPYTSVTGNETVKVIGSFSQSKSHIPSNHYHLSPFSNLIKDIIPIEKKPCVYDLTSGVPQNYLDEIEENNYGEKCQRTTLALPWAHKNCGDRSFITQVGKEFYTKIATHYQDMRLLTDEETLAGLKDEKWRDYLGGMELDTSIGFTMKELFYVTKKSDVIGKTEEGKYYFQTNSAATFLKEEFEIAQNLAKEGKKFLNVFTEILKMEKLKLTKIYRGRTFVSEDILGVLMERKILGMFNARAYKCDPECGIGSDPNRDFNRIYTKLSKFENLFAIDYKNYDRSIPAKVMIELKYLLKKANPKMANELESVFSTLIERIQVSGTTLSEVFGGLPSGCFVTASLNSLLNEFIMFLCFAILCEERDMEWTWKLYNDNIVRFFYGDDGILSVSDEYKDIFNRSNIARVAEENFGMHMDSSTKDGSISGFDTFEDASWISRFFRKLGKYPLQVGALKKISIGANFHYVTSLDLEHIGTLMERAQYEAAKWEPEYFYTIQTAIRRSIELKPNLVKYVNLRMQETIHEEMFQDSMPMGVVWQNTPNGVIFQERTYSSWAEEVDAELPLTAEAKDVKINLSNLPRLTFEEKYRFSAQYFKQIINRERFTYKMSYMQKLNEYFQQGKCTKPEYVLTKSGPDNLVRWDCKLTLSIKGKEYFALGYSATKQLAKEEAAYIMVLNHFGAATLPERRNQFADVETQCDWNDLGRSSFLDRCERQMNVTPGIVGQVPMPQMIAKDASVVSDGGLFTNVDAFAQIKMMNTDALALDNPAGTGAPFSKHTSCYKIYQRWTEKNAVISPALSAGTEIFRLSLDPQTWPQRLQDYVLLHDSIIPELDIVVSIAGAAGTIGWITHGWVRDASDTKVYSLEDLQQVASETSNMNGTQIFKVALTDVRKSGLYRRTVNDPEPYPGVIFMIDHAVTNVQRNDSVGYPVRVQARLGPACILMEPFGKGSTPIVDNFDLGSYMLTNALDLLVGSTGVTSDQSVNQSYPDGGFNLGVFKPTFNEVTCLTAEYLPAPANYILAYTVDATPSADFITQLKDASSSATPGSVTNIMPIRLTVGVGEVSIPDDWKTWKGTVYTVPAQYVKFGCYSYSITQMYVQNKGAVLMLDMEYVIDDKYFIVVKSKKGNSSIYAEGITFHFQNDDSFKVPVYFVDDNDKVTGSVFTINGFPPNPPNIKQTRILIDPREAVELKVFDVFVQTGNSIPASNLPTGLKQLHFTRQGTTSTVSDDQPFSNINNPVIFNAGTALSTIINHNNWSALSGDLYIDDLNIGQIGYQSHVFFVRTDAVRKLKPGISNRIFLRNLSNLTDPQGLTTFNTTGFVEWSTELTDYQPKVVNLESAVGRTQMLNQCVRQAEFAALGGMAIQGIGSGLGKLADMTFQRQMLDKVLANQRGITDANNIALAERAKQLFQRNLELKGYGSASMQMGQAGPREENQTPGVQLQSFVSSGTEGGDLHPITASLTSIPVSTSHLDDQSVQIHAPTLTNGMISSDAAQIYTTPSRDAKVIQSNHIEVPQHATPIEVAGKKWVSSMNPTASSFIPGMSTELSDFIPGAAGRALKLKSPDVGETEV